MENADIHRIWSQKEFSFSLVLNNVKFFLLKNESRLVTDIKLQLLEGLHVKNQWQHKKLSIREYIEKLLRYYAS